MCTCVWSGSPVTGPLHLLSTFHTWSPVTGPLLLLSTFHTCSTFTQNSFKHLEKKKSSSTSSSWTPFKREDQGSFFRADLVQLLQPVGELLRYVMQLLLRLLVLLPSVGRRPFSRSFLLQPRPVEEDTADVLTPSTSSHAAAVTHSLYLGLLVCLWHVRMSEGLFVAHVFSFLSSSPLCGGERLAAALSSCRLRYRTSGWGRNKTLLRPPGVGWDREDQQLLNTYLPIETQTSPFSIRCVAPPVLPPPPPPPPAWLSADRTRTRTSQSLLDTEGDVESMTVLSFSVVGVSTWCHATSMRPSERSRSRFVLVRTMTQGADVTPVSWLSGWLHSPGDWSPLTSTPSAGDGQLCI